MSSFLSRVGAAPISWGICEAPGWGEQMPVDRVLGEMASLGITATEQGALGWLPTEAAAQRAKLDEYGMSLLGGFVPLVLHDPAQRDAELAQAERIAAAMAACGGTYFVTACVGSQDHWFRPELDEAQWAELLANLGRVEEIVGAHGLVQAMHPHVDTVIETADDFDRFLQGCDVHTTFDTGHLTIGGADVVALTREFQDRIGLVHLKDVNESVAEQLRAGELGLMSATQAGLFPSIGDGTVRVAEVIEILESNGYTGRYVMETDVALTDGLPEIGAGPMLGVARSLAYLKGLELDGAHS
jgi:inosose dehydratase